MRLPTGREISAGIDYARALTGYIARSDRATGGPVSVAIEPANICNLRCPQCATGSNSLTRPKGCMSFDAFKLIIDSLPSSVCELYLWGQGEPFLAPDFLRMVGYASSRGFKTIVSTNGHFLDNPEEIVSSGLDVLIVSLDGVDEDTYTSYRVGGNFSRVVNGIKCVAGVIARNNHGPAIELQYLVTRENAGDIGAFKSLALSIGVHRVVIKTMQVISLEEGSSVLPDDMNYTRYRKNNSRKLETNRSWYLKNRCLRLYYSFQIDWQGNVVPCCFDKNSENIMGNIFREPVTHIWNNEKYRSFRNILNIQGRMLPMCRNCTEGLKRKTLHA